MYKLISTISFIIRAYLCYLTIDKIPILENPIANTILLEVISIYTILMIVSRATVGRFYNRGENPTFGVIAYFFIYIIYLGIAYAILLFLTITNIRYQAENKSRLILSTQSS